MKRDVHLSFVIGKDDSLIANINGEMLINEDIESLIVAAANIGSTFASGTWDKVWGASSMSNRRPTLEDPNRLEPQ